ncbi:MAG: class B sortase [Lachnospiraceae bacterium]|nr:class B sortase [Lachnospiraceae bacterium]
MANRKRPGKKKQKDNVIREKSAKKSQTVDNSIQRKFWDNEWVRYQRKRIVAKFGSFKKEQTGGKWDRRRILSAVSALVVLIAVCGLLFTFLEYRKSDRIYGKAEADYVTVFDKAELSQGQANGSGNGDNGTDGGGTNTGSTEGSIGAGGNADGSAGTEGIQKAWYKQISVDLESLQAAYPDVAGWLYFENESISYPVMYSGDNERYLRTAYTGKAANAGSIFLDGEGSRDFSDPHTLIYGHNMKNLSMFGRLRYYRTEKDYYDGHRYFQIFTGSYIYRYEIFAYGQIPADSSIYYVYGASLEDGNFKGLIRELKNISMQDTGVEVGPSDHVITLSTCTGDGDVRMIVSAVRVDEHRR